MLAAVKGGASGWDKKLAGLDAGWKFLAAAAVSAFILAAFPPFRVAKIEGPAFQILAFLLTLVVVSFAAYLLYRSLKTVFLAANGKPLNRFDYAAIPLLVLIVLAVLLSITPCCG